MISVVIPTYRRLRALSVCLEAISVLDFPRERFEVIVVNDGGDPVDDELSPFRDRLNLAVFVQPHEGPASARNAGAAAAKGRYLAFLDDDCVPEQSWLAALRRRFDATPTHAVGGRTVNALTDNLYASASQMITDYLSEYYARGQQPLFFSSNNLAFPRDTFQSVGGFDPAFPSAAGEDRDLCDRWQRHGYGMTFAPDAVVRHAHSLSARSFCQQHFNYGRGACSFRRARARRNGGGLDLEPPQFYLNLLRCPFSRTAPLRASALSGLLVLSQVAHTAGFLWEERLRFSTSS